MVPATPPAKCRISEKPSKAAKKKRRRYFIFPVSNQSEWAEFSRPFPSEMSSESSLVCGSLAFLHRSTLGVSDCKSKLKNWGKWNNYARTEKKSMKILRRKKNLLHPWKIGYLGQKKKKSPCSGIKNIEAYERVGLWPSESSQCASLRPRHRH